MTSSGNRSVAVIGLGSMVLIVAGVASGPAKIISTNSSVAKIAASVGTHTQLQAVSNTVTILGAFLFLAFAANISHRLRGTTSTAPLGMCLTAIAAIIAVFTTLDVVVLTALSFLSKQGGLTAEPQLTRLLYHLYNGIFMPGLAHLGFAAYFAIIGLGARRGVLQPRWVAWPSLVLAPLALLNGVIGLTASNGGAFPIAPLAVLGFVVITVTLSISLLRDRTLPDNLAAPVDDRGVVTTVRSD